MFNSESYGLPSATDLEGNRNGFYRGKQWAGVSIAMWKEDIAKGQLKVWELYEDPKLPHWWLDREFGDCQKKRPTLEQMSLDILGYVIKRK